MEEIQLEFQFEENSKEKLNNSNVIRDISFDQKEILYNIMRLYNDGKPFDCDMTASELKFYQSKIQINTIFLNQRFFLMYFQSKIR